MSAHPPGSDDPTAPLPGGASDRGGAAEARPSRIKELAGDKVGPYPLVSGIGEGGMGVVWLAERRQPFDQRVALKLMHLGRNWNGVATRFEQER